MKEQRFSGKDKKKLFGNSFFPSCKFDKIVPKKVQFGQTSFRTAGALRGKLKKIDHGTKAPTRTFFPTTGYFCFSCISKNPNWG